MKIVVDPGHGGEDAGAVFGEVRESRVALAIAIALGDELQRRGHNLLLTRHRDESVSLRLRTQLANDFRADAFISVHANAAESEEPNGAWIIHAEGSERGQALADRIFDELLKLPGIADDDAEREVFPDRSGAVGGRRLHVLRKTRMPAVLVEVGFGSNPSDLSDLLAPARRRAIAAAIADGIEKWAKLDAELSPAPRPLPAAELLGLPVHQVARPGESTVDFLARVTGRLHELAL